MTNKSNGVVVDSSAWYALASEADRFHASAFAALDYLVAEGLEISTNSYVIIEAASLLHRRMGFESVGTFFDRTKEASIEWVGQSLHVRAQSMYVGRAGLGLSLVDWTVLLQAADNGFQVFTFDRRFAREGANVIPSLP